MELPNVIVRSPHTPYSIYLKRNISTCTKGSQKFLNLLQHFSWAAFSLVQLVTVEKVYLSEKPLEHLCKVWVQVMGCEFLASGLLVCGLGVGFRVRQAGEPLIPSSHNTLQQLHDADE